MLELLFAFAGLGTGRVLNLCMDRLFPGSSPKGALVCPSSSHRKGTPLGLLPLVSYLWQRRSRPCDSERIPLRPPLVELATALLFALLVWRFGLGTHLGVYLSYTCVLVVVFVIDLERQLILNKVTYPAMALALGLSWLIPEVGPVSSVFGGLFGTVTLSLPLFVYGRRGMFGAGDVKLGALVGLMTGWPVVVLALLGSAMAGAVSAVFLMVFRGRRLTDVVPFAPFLAAATVLALFWGQTASQWLLGHLP